MTVEPPAPSGRDDIAAELAGIAAAGRLRQRPVIDSPDGRVVILRRAGRRHHLLNWASNDYLGSATERSVVNAARRHLRRFGAGAGAARLLAGGLGCHRQLEVALARWLGRDDCLLTTTGYQANLAALVALAGRRGDLIVLDRRCHASLYDGARLAGARLRRFRHNDPADLDQVLAREGSARRRLVAVEGVYSMDGDLAPLAAIAAVCAARGALLLVDEAHALGVLGEGGRGACAAAGVRPDLLIGTCSKALGAQGGIIVADAPVVDLVVNQGRSFIYSTAPAPAAVGAALGGLRRLRTRPGLPIQLRRRVADLRAMLTASGWPVPVGETPIIPLVVGDETAAVALADALFAAGHFAPAIRPPTVSAGSCRVRLTVTLAHRDADFRRLVAALAALRPPA
jgi:8-amino-7-oxononanoate synthase